MNFRERRLQIGDGFYFWKLHHGKIKLFGIGGQGKRDECECNNFEHLSRYSPFKKIAMSFRWKTSDGEERIARAWPRQHGHGVLACVHGLSGSGEQFEPVSNYLDSFSVYALELRGQGLDPIAERRAMLLDVDAQLRDLGDFLNAIRASHPGEPVYLFGESMGALLCARFAAVHPDDVVEGLILSVPVVALTRPVPPWIKFLVRIAAGAFPRRKLPPSLFVSGESTALPLTRDRAYQDSLREKPNYLRSFSFRFLSELGDLIEQSRSTAQAVRKPTLVLAAGQDYFVKISQIEEWFALLGSADKTLNVYPEAYHLLWHDHDRDAVLCDVASWLKLRAG